MEIQHNANDYDTVFLFDFQNQLKSLFLSTHPIIGIHLTQIIKKRQYILNVIHKKYEESLRESVESTESSGHEDQIERTNENGLTQSSISIGSEKSEPLLSENGDEKSINEIPPILSKYFFVDNNERYKCGIMQCNQIIEKENFFAHLEAHDPNYPFICVHCNENVGNSRCKALSHMYLHYQYLYCCGICKYTRSSRFLMVDHLLKHLDADTQFWYKDQVFNEIKLVQLRYLCKECDINVRAPKDLAEHFYDYHESQMVDFKVTADFRNQLTDKYLIRKQLNCAHCHSSYNTKGELIQHHRNEHMTEKLNIKLGDLTLFPIKNMSKHQINIYTKNNAKNDRNIIFHCRNCDDNGANVFADIKEMYEHFNAMHKPNDFKFEISHLIVCHYCKFISNFHVMKNHQKNVHQRNPFAIKQFLNPDKCGICNEKVSEIVKHCNEEHEMLQHTKIVDPIHINEDLLLELLKFHCDINAVQYTIVGCCFEEIPATMNGLLYHILCHLEPIHCARCSFSSSDGFKFAKHNCMQYASNILTRFQRNLHDIFFDTRFVFKNGLTVTRANLIGTGYDNDQSFDFNNFINEMMNIHKGRAN